MGKEQIASINLASANPAPVSPIPEKIDDAQTWGALPKKVILETINDEKIEVNLRFPAKKELQIIALIRSELDSVESELPKLLKQELDETKQIGILMDYIPSMAIVMASVLMDKEKNWIEENLGFSEIAKVVKPFFMNWLGILGPGGLQNIKALTLN